MAAPARLSVVAGLIVVISVFVLGWNLRATRIGSAYVDPIAKIRAQDESMYVNSATRMTEDGDWLNPKLMGRLFLFKAPLLQWLAAACIQLFGLGLIVVRLPSLVMGAAGVGVVFAWTSLRRSWPVASMAALLLVSDSIWVTLARLCFTDVLAGTLALVAMYAMALDPALGNRRSRILFGALSGTAMLAKSIVGVLPFAALALYWIAMPRSARPRFRHVVECAAAAVIVAAPWHCYQAFVHPKWFWIEFVKFQLLAVGVTAPTGVIGYPFFYIRRLAMMDPVLSIVAAVALYAAFRAVRMRDPVQMVALCWTAMVALALTVFRGRSVSYMALLSPGLCILGGLLLPRAFDRRWPAVGLLLVAAFGIKASVRGYPWSLPYDSQTVDSANALRDYYQRNRDTELIIAAPDDSFYAIALPRLKVRYAYVDPAGSIAGFAPHYLELGIAVTPAQLATLPRLIAEPLAAAILLQTPADMEAVIRARPSADFDVPATWELLLAGASKDTHLVERSRERLFLLARGVHARPEAPPALPVGW